MLTTLLDKMEEVFNEGQHNIPLEHRRIFTPKVTKITIDLEVAVINAILLLFPGVAIILCFFHMSQAVFRKMQKMGFYGNIINH